MWRCIFFVDKRVYAWYNLMQDEISIVEEKKS